MLSGMEPSAMKFPRANPLTIGTVLAVVAGVSGVYGFAGDFGFQIDRFAWKSELEEIAAIALDDLLLRKERRLWAVNSAIQDAQNKGQVVPRHFIVERNLLVREIRRLRKRLGD